MCYSLYIETNTKGAIKMKAYKYNELVREYKRRLAMNEAIKVTLNADGLAAYTKVEAQKIFNRNASIASDLKLEILNAKKDGLVYA